MKILLTGCAGFIGMHTALRFLLDGNEIVGVDNLNNYYDVNLKKARLNQLNSSPDFKFYEMDVSDKEAIKELFATEKPKKVVHLAAQAGVRYSLINPHAYIDANIQGFLNILEGCRYNDVQHLVYASSSSVYGSNTSLPFDESQNIDHPISLYAATKKANELMAHTYSHLYNLPTTGLRFFTVYGPWGRPDMALFKFTQAILANKPIDIYNHGKMIRDFTYIDDIVEGIIRVTRKVATADSNFSAATPSPAISNAPYRVFNIGNNNPIPLISYISALEDALGIEAQKDYLPMQPGDVPATASNTEALNKWVDFKPNTPIAKGIKNFVDWYRYYYKVDNPVI
ncbi:NAD-dependent epimerase [Legionella gresilensis]|uniref:NAD-dependent epimerase n=1 Tax=Legionella gresilensis TaxID=91823 RepID=UPI00104144F2|nr:NAD-dependent epimerase [Legionella gresilensis]